MIWYFVIGLNIIAVIIFIYLILRVRKKWKGIKHYEKIRDELTLREEEEEEPEEEPRYTSFPIGKLVGLLVVVLVGITIIPAVTNTLMTEMQVMNNTALPQSAQTLVGIMPLLFGLGALAMGVSVVMGFLRRGGLV